MPGLSGLTGLSGLSGIFGGGLTYLEKLLSLAAWAGLYPLNETAGAQATDYSGNARHGTYTGVTLNNAAGPTGEGTPFFDGANDYVSCPLTAVLSGNAGTMVAWCKVNAAAVWTDGVVRNAVVIFASAANEIYFAKMNAVNRLDIVRRANAVNQTHTETPYSNTGWFHLAIVYSAAGNYMRAFINGVPQPDVAGANVFSAALSQVNIGARTATPTNTWHGWLAYAGFTTALLSDAVIAQIATV